MFTQRPNGASEASDSARTTVSVNGITLESLLHAVCGRVTPDGVVEEHEHRGAVMIGDGSIVEDLRLTARCDVCAAEAELAALSGRLCGQAVLLASRHRPEVMARSAASGFALCPRHQRVVHLEDGAAVVLAPSEAEAVDRERRRAQRWRRIASLFVEFDDARG